MGLFVADDGGYTTVAVAVALLVSLSLVFCLATAEWVGSRSADVQQVADATALAGENSVAAFCTVAQVLDACVLSLGLVGVVVCAVGLIVAAVPGAQAVSARVMGLGHDVMDARRRFARSAASGLRRLEATLPYLVVVNSASVVGANSGHGGPELVGCAIPFPQESMTDFSALDAEVTSDEMEEDAERLRDASRRRDEAKARADAARERGWRADCVDDPSCLHERASSLAGLSPVQNPCYAAPELWNFGVPVSRSRSYYAARLALEGPEGAGVEEMTDSAARQRFYSFALREMWSASFSETPEGEVSLSLPELPKNSAEMRQTSLYEEASWPCTAQASGVTLHSSLACPGADGPLVGFGSLASLESGSLVECPVCRMGVGDLGRVAAISSRATNGYEYYWAIVVEASREYQVARNEQVAAEREMREIGAEGSKAFQQALDQLAVPRPRLCPPGAWGAVSVVFRRGGTGAPSELVGSFTRGVELPPGAAMSAACLAPEESTDGSNLLSHVLDGLRGRGFALGDLVYDVTGLWGRLLVSYGSAYDSASDAISGFLDDVDGVFGGTVGAWIKGRIEGVVSRAALEPADMRLRKPVLVGTQEVFDRAGVDGAAKARELVNALPAAGSGEDVARALGLWLVDEAKARAFEVAELPVPGTELSIPLTVDLSRLGSR